MNKKFIEKIFKDKNGVTIITPRNFLREKIGFGGLDPLIMERAEEYIKTNGIDYQPFARELMGTLDTAIESAQAKKIRDRAIINSIAAPIMRLKGSGGMFQYPLISEIADIVLNFLEGLDSLNDDAFDILAVHQKILSAIIAGNLTGDGGKTGRALANELYSACARYNKKHGVAEKN